jgi:RimJ/RimL family protein N-acetyltransferase
MTARIRAAVPADAAALLELKQRLDRETSFMIFEAGEREASVQDLAADLASAARSGNSVVIVADAGDHLSGYVELAGGVFRRSRATARVVIGVRQDASGAGVGAALLRQAIDWASGRGLHRLELTVMAHNHRAVRLYQRMGFSLEGRRKQCLIVDGQFVDELTMAAILPARPPAPPSRRSR